MIMHIFHINELLGIIAQHTALAYLLILIVSFSESLALVGLIVPGTLIMFGIGAIVSTGTLNIRAVLGIAVLGAVMGDGVSYWLGHHYKDHLRNIWPLSRYPGLLKKGIVFFQRHGGKSVLLGRFVGPVRPVIPAVAGMMGMEPLYFLFINVLSAIGWALFFIMPGFFLGTSLTVAGAVSARLVILFLILCVAGWLFMWLGRRLASLIAFVISFSRFYSGVNRLFNVMGGFFTGTNRTTFFGIAWLKKINDKVPGILPGIVIILVITMAGGLYITRYHKIDIGLYAPRHILQPMAYETWLNGGWKSLAAWRFDIVDDREQPMTLQFAGSTDELARYLLTLGWHRPLPVNWKNVLGIFAPHTPIAKFPVLPHFHSGRIDVMRLIYSNINSESTTGLSSGCRWILRLWPSDFRIAKSDKHLFVGTIEVQRFRHFTGLITAVMDTGEYGHPLARVQNMLGSRFLIKRVTRSYNDTGVNDYCHNLRWHGMVLLIYQNVVTRVNGTASIVTAK